MTFYYYPIKKKVIGQRDGRCSPGKEVVMYKIMLADDEGIVIDSLKFIIEKEFGSDCEVEFAKTGRSVIELAETFRPDIAVMDIQMPGINGIEAMKEIRKNNNNVIFIVMSAYDKFDYAKEYKNKEDTTLFLPT